jgi:predicted neutral ceramidase superfamily lipid hydrolase
MTAKHVMPLAMIVQVDAIVTVTKLMISRRNPLPNKLYVEYIIIADSPIMLSVCVCCIHIVYVFTYVLKWNQRKGVSRRPVLCYCEQFKYQ